MYAKTVKLNNKKKTLMDLPLILGNRTYIGNNLPLKLSTTPSRLTLASIRSSHEPQNANDGPQLQRWSYKIIMELINAYHLVAVITS